MQGLRNRTWLIVGAALMLAAIFAYVATLDDADPDPAAAPPAVAGNPPGAN